VRRPVEPEHIRWQATACKGLKMCRMALHDD